MKPNLIFIEKGYAYLTTVDAEFDVVRELVTTCLGKGRYVRIDDGRQYPQLCAGGHRTGNTLTYHDDEQLARDCNARLFKYRAGYDAARARALGYYVREGSYQDSTDDRLGRFYFGHRDDNGFRPYGVGHPTAQEAWEAALEHAKGREDRL